MSSVLAQASTLLAVAVGALMTYLVTSANERTRWRRERSARWDAARMEAYFAYSHALKASVHVAIRVAATRGLGAYAPPLAIDEGLTKLAAMESERGALWEKVLLLGDPKTIEAGRDWHEQAWQLAWFAEGRATGADAWASTVEAAEQARHRFYEHARRSLEVTQAAIPVSGWTRKQTVFGFLGDAASLAESKQPHP